MTRVAVIGAGMGGICAAYFLKKIGIEVTIFEQAPQFLRLGAGINFGSNGTRVFRAMGLGERMLDVGIRPQWRSNRKWDTGEPFYVVDNSKLAENFGSEVLAFHRADLHDMLVNAVGLETFQLDKRLVALEPDGANVKLRFADGWEDGFDAVIGADGLHSTVRHFVIGAEPPKYFGHTAYRAIVPTEKLAGTIELTDYIRWWGPDNSYVLAYCMNEGRQEYNVVAAGREDLQKDELKPMPIPVEHMKSFFHELCSDARLVLENCEEVVRWPMMIRSPQRPWSKGRITLLGDAAHPMTPHIGQGGGMAVEDAMILARCVKAYEGRDFERAFQLYEDCRFERTSEVQYASQENKIGRGDRSLEWLFSYDVTTAPLEANSVTPST